MIALFLWSALAAGALPDVVDIATPTQATDLFGDYAVDNGLLYHRKDAHQPWALVDGVGLPNLGGKVLPEVKGKLTRVYADGNVVAVVDEDDQVFRYDTNLHVIDLEPALYAWRTEWGDGILKLRKDLRSLAYGRRTIANVGVVDDRFGDRMLAANPSSLVSVFHENGHSGLMHFYGLSTDGRRLFFADNGLTKVFNYEFDLPRADDFVGVSVAASASMVVVLDEKGRFWAKFLDFDWYGSNPMMFEYSYVKDDTPPDDDHLEGFGRIHIPLPDWKQLPPIPLAKNAWFSSEMGMAVTGKGNDARELRVRGVDQHGTCGLYTVDLRENRWGFRATGICAKARFVPAAEVPRVSRTTTLTGGLVVDGIPYRATVSGYSLVDSPVRLELVDDRTSTVAFRGALHLVPAWSPLEVQDPGRDGRYKLFYATIDADADFAASAFARGRNLQAFALTVYGGKDDAVFKWTREDALLGKLGAPAGEGFTDEVTRFIVDSSQERGVPAACRDVTARIEADRQATLQLVSATPALNAFGLVTGLRFWYWHGISMIPPLGRMMDWGTRLLYDRYRLTQYEQQLARRHCPG